MLGDIEDEATACDAENVVLSSEVFFSLTRYQIVQLKQLLNSHVVKVYTYLRRQDEFFTPSSCSMSNSLQCASAV